MDVDEETIIEIRENTAVTRQKVEHLEEKLDDKDEKISKNSQAIDENSDDIDENAREIAKIKMAAVVLVTLITIVAGMHGWVVPFI